MARVLLKVAGAWTFALALFQAVVSFSPTWSSYFGAPRELADNPVRLLAAGLAVSVVLVGCGLYALSGAGAIRPLPRRQLVLWAAGSIFTLRGLLVVPALLVAWCVLPSAHEMPPTALASSWTALALGILYLLGAWLARPDMAPGRPPPAAAPDSDRT